MCVSRYGAHHCDISYTIHHMVSCMVVCMCGYFLFSSPHESSELSSLKGSGIALCHFAFSSPIIVVRYSLLIILCDIPDH
ncbi:hypothetical protein EON63_10335 [archaeon]|nr:MAG: hypothetical protein EON63_10335 [archaeon]